MLLSLVLSPLVGCAQDGTIDATYAVFLHEDTSENIAKLRAKTDAVACEYANYEGDDIDVDTEAIFGDDCYVQRAEAEKKFAEDNKLTPVDCRYLTYFGYSPEEYRDALLVNSDYEASCCVEAMDEDSANDPDGDPFTTDDCTPYIARYFTFLNSYSYYETDGAAVTDDGQTYKVEAVLTSEHDLQLTVHTTTEFGDFRFGWVIDPDFQPRTCIDDGNGGAVESLVDGGDWVDGWSSGAGDEDSRVYHLNAGAYQINPSNSGDFWYFAQDWSAGYCFARFGEEEFYCHAPDYQDMSSTANLPYGQPLYAGTYSQSYPMESDDFAGYEGFEDLLPLFGGFNGYYDLDCGGVDDCYTMEDYTDMHDELVRNIEVGGEGKWQVVNASDGSTLYESTVNAVALNNELSAFGKVPEGAVDLKLRVEENGWRTLQEGGAGVGNWGAVSPSWVSFKNTVDLTALEVGKQDTPIEGEFMLYFDAISSASHLVVRGSFTVDNIVEDPLAVDPLEETKRLEDETPICGD